MKNTSFLIIILLFNIGCKINKKSRPEHCDSIVIAYSKGKISIYSDDLNNMLVPILYSDLEIKDIWNSEGALYVPKDTKELKRCTLLEFSKKEKEWKVKTLYSEHKNENFDKTKIEISKWI